MSVAMYGENRGLKRWTTKKVRVAQINRKGKVVRIYASMRRAYAATHIKNLHLVVRGDLEQAGGYKWVAC